MPPEMSATNHHRIVGRTSGRGEVFTIALMFDMQWLCARIRRAFNSSKQVATVGCLLGCTDECPHRDSDGGRRLPRSTLLSACVESRNGEDARYSVSKTVARVIETD